MKKTLVAAIIGGLVVLAGSKLTGGAPLQPLSEKKTAYDHVIQSGIVRCAYAAYYPFLIIDTNGHLKGIFYDVVNEAARRLNLKVDWTEEVNYGNINAGFVTGRYDAFCAGLWPAGSRAATTLFSRGVVWAPLTVYVRGNDPRFDGHMDMLNDRAYKIAYIEGDATASMVDAVFPKASHAVMSQNNNIPEEIMQVTTGKADALFSDYLGADQFNQGAPGGLKDLSPGSPVLTFPVTIGFNQHENALRDMFDVVLGDMDRDGTIGRIVKTHLADKSNLIYRQQSEFIPF